MKNYISKRRTIPDVVWFIGFMFAIACIACILSGTLRTKVSSDFNKMWSITVVR